MSSSTVHLEFRENILIKSNMNNTIYFPIYIILWWQDLCINEFEIEIYPVENYSISGGGKCKGWYEGGGGGV